MSEENGKFNIYNGLNSINLVHVTLENQNYDKRNYSLSIWDHKDNFLCLLKPSSGTLEGQCYNDSLVTNIYGEKTLSFTIPAYISPTKENDKWNYIFNEQKIRYTEYDDITNKPKNIQEFVLKHYDENRNGYEKTIDCQCESLATFELAKVGWGINFNVDYITQYEIENNPEDYLTLDYWLRKIFYTETNLGRVSTTTECTYLLQGLQLRDNEGFPIDNEYAINTQGNYYTHRIDEPICSDEVPQNYYNTTGWYWEVQAVDPRRLDKQITTSTLYEEPRIDRYIQATPNNYLPYSYQQELEDESTKKLRPYPIEKENYSTLRYITDIKKRVISCERSNIFSIIQTLCEAFEVWAYFNYEYNEQGKIISRKILFKSSVINEQINFDFSYGKNLQSCERSVDSNELVTKLIVPDTESNLDSNKILSIKQATANPTNEGYIYNFEYFYNIDTLSKLTDAEKNGDVSITNHSDEYKINYHCGQLKSINEQIFNLQSYLTPLYDRQISLSTDLTVQQASVIAIKDNIQSIQDKINAIPSEIQAVNSWAEDNNQYNHIGELKTLSTTTVGNETKYYINFGRDDVLFKDNIVTPIYQINEEGELITGDSITIPSYTPRYYTNTTWTVGSEVTNNDFTTLSTSIGQPIFSDIEGYIKGFYLNSDINLNRTYVRIRYQYAPLAYYYALIKQYWDKLIEQQELVQEAEIRLQEVNNKIVANELNLNNLLAIKNELILQFEKEYKSYIKEGYWEPSDYQSQIASEQLDTSSTTNIYEGFNVINRRLSDLNLNESLHNYTYYINLNEYASNIDIDSIEMTTANPAYISYNTILPRYRGNDFEVFIQPNGNVILGIAPNLIDTYEVYEYDLSYYKSNITYKDSLGNDVIKNNVVWINFTEENSPEIQEKYIYLSNDNILTSTLQVYGKPATEDNLLELFTDYTYGFDYAGYDSEGNRVSLDDQTSYLNNIYYDYITKITLKNTNKVNSFNNGQGPYIVKYSNETTLQYLYNDAVSTSKKYAVPQITYSVSVVDISKLNDYKNYKPVLGQKVPIYDPEMHLNGYQGIITSIQKDLEQPENTQIEISTYQTRFEDIFQKLTTTMTDIRYNSNDIYNAANSFTSEGNIKTEVFQKSLDDNNFSIQLGVNNDITIDKQSGITLIDQDNNNAVKIIGNGIFLTDNYLGNISQWRTGITGEGINANALTAGNIDTKQINIWNASEGQIRFVWNEQGLFAYGATGVPTDENDSVQDFIDYNKYVKLNYDGLKFQDSDSNGNTRSALSLGWDGLKIQAQNNALQLDAENGLTLKQWNGANSITRLELGKLDNNSIYGLKLYNTDGEPTLQSDSDGNLWLSKYLKVGGVYNNQSHTYTIKPTAGIVGIENPAIANQMGVIRNTSTGEVMWNNNPIRFWAGPQTKQQYLSNLSISNDDIYGISEWNSIQDYDPSLSRFKVDSAGNIIASGIDVGGWIGAGKILRSQNYEAILRSGEYYINETNYPVLAIGKYTTNTSGINYNFRVFQDGTVSIGRDQFIANSNGAVIARNLTIEGGNISISGSSEEPAININNVFRVMKDGSVQATNINIGGSNSSIVGGSIAGWNIEESKFYKLINNTYLTALYANRSINVSYEPVLYIGELDHEQDDLESDNISLTDMNKTQFKISSDGSVFFHGGIWGWSNSESKFKKGLDSGRISFYTTDNNAISVEVCQGLIVDIRNV